MPEIVVLPMFVFLAQSFSMMAKQEQQRYEKSYRSRSQLQGPGSLDLSGVTPTLGSQSSSRCTNLTDFSDHKMVTPAKSGKKDASDCTPPPSKSNDTSNTSPSNTRGLRHMSVQICQKVKEWGETTCNDVAEELIKMVRGDRDREGRDFAHDKKSQKSIDDKNVRRRVYDALNVLDAVGVIKKDSKDIVWKGMPNSTKQEVKRIQEQRNKCLKRIQSKREELQEKMVQQVCYQNLVRHNKQRDGVHARQSERTEGEFDAEQDHKIQVPFLVLNTDSQAEIHCYASRDLSHVMMDVGAPFSIHDDNSVLRQLGMNYATLEDLNAFFQNNDLIGYCKDHELLNCFLPLKYSATKRTFHTPQVDSRRPPEPKRVRSSLLQNPTRMQEVAPLKSTSAPLKRSSAKRSSFAAQVDRMQAPLAKRARSTSNRRR